MGKLYNLEGLLPLPVIRVQLLYVDVDTAQTVVTSMRYSYE